eukprot:CAMPEP_0195525480 /NCGR_PEP_ID=MMETSP0794_2-20130614/25972_1 /TAXON_ID=515487 /ORGANISM="Stephanopyxis turris, Strain CCMP 815" /LENGTH=85 /DNA_ID=CAMNT_0040655959 /DNA_START=28 /DNA_END=285 /DNA_ORIENTATION=+
MNGLSMLGGSVSKAAGPFFAGVLLSFFFTAFSHVGSVIAFSTIALLGFLATGFVHFLSEDTAEEVKSDTSGSAQLLDKHRDNTTP